MALHALYQEGQEEQYMALHALKPPDNSAVHCLLLEQDPFSIEAS